MARKRRPSAGFERFGLMSNPFQALDSESAKDIDLYHVRQPADESLLQLKEEVLDLQTKAVVALVGPLGSGKTQRLLVTATEAEHLGHYCVFVQLSEDVQWIARTFTEAFRAAARLGAFKRFASPPKWYQQIAKLPRQTKRRYDPERVGRLLAEALNANAPSFLLLNDVQNILKSDEAERFLQTLQAMTTHLDQGVLVLLTSLAEYWDGLERQHGALTSRFHRVFRIEALADDDAALLIAKRLAGKRIVEDLDPTYPFDREAIAAMNLAVQHNPRELLKLADRALEHAVRTRAYRVDVDAIATLASAVAAPATAEEPLPETSAPPPETLTPVLLSHAAAPAPSREGIPPDALTSVPDDLQIESLLVSATNGHALEPRKADVRPIP